MSNLAVVSSKSPSENPSCKVVRIPWVDLLPDTPFIFLAKVNFHDLHGIALEGCFLEST